MNATILSIGDELVAGLTVNTNASWLSERLMAAGIATLRHVTVGDQMEAIVDAIRACAAGGGVLLISGGLGPTEDDLTRVALAKVLGEELIEDEAAMARLKAWFASRGRAISPSNFVQAMRPPSARCLENTWGTAPGLYCRVGEAEVFVMPGVPREMREMFSRSVLPALETGDRVTLCHKINTFGLGESVIGERIRDLMDRGGAEPGLSVGTTVHEGIVSVRIYATGTRDAAAAMGQRIAAEVKRRLGAVVFGDNDETLEAATGALLKAASATVATAESCTGGMIAEMLTSVPGSSAYVLRGWVTYSNESKTDELGVDPQLIATRGAVSEDVARAMAAGARERAGTTWALSVTGIAGPDGGTADKPVGTVWLGLAGPYGVEARRYIFPGDRAAVRLRAAQMTLAWLRWTLLGPDVAGEFTRPI